MGIHCLGGLTTEIVLASVQHWFSDGIMYRWRLLTGIGWCWFMCWLRTGAGELSRKGFLDETWESTRLWGVDTSWHVNNVLTGPAVLWRDGFGVGLVETCWGSIKLEHFDLDGVVDTHCVGTKHLKVGRCAVPFILSDSCCSWALVSLPFTEHIIQYTKHISVSTYYSIIMKQIKSY